MRNSFNQISSPLRENLTDLFLKDSLADVLIITNDRIFPMRKNLLKKVGYFEDKLHRQNKLYIKELKIDIKAFEKVMGQLYGIKICLDKSQEKIKILEVTEVLQYQSLKEELLCEIQKNYEQYGFFLLYNIAEKYSCKWLQQKCQEDLLVLQFEQMNFNRYDLFQLDLQSFTKVIKKHEVYKLKRNIKGLSKETVTQIVDQYSQKNGCNISSKQIMKITEEDIQMIESIQLNREFQMKEKKKGLIRKRSRTWAVCDTQKQDQNIPIKTALKLKKKTSIAHGLKQQTKKYLKLLQKQNAVSTEYGNENLKATNCAAKDCGTPTTKQDESDYKYDSFDSINNQMNDKFLDSAQSIRAMSEISESQQFQL